MKCPYCDEEMKHGVIEGRDTIHWKPKRASFFKRTEFYEDTIILSEEPLVSFYKGASVDAYRCDHCKKIIIDYDNN